jgi:hypothetical protein
MNQFPNFFIVVAFELISPTSQKLHHLMGHDLLYLQKKDDRNLNPKQEELLYEGPHGRCCHQQEKTKY